jgi:hypothetical protein
MLITHPLKTCVNNIHVLIPLSDVTWSSIALYLQVKICPLKVTKCMLGQILLRIVKKKKVKITNLPIIIVPSSYCMHLKHEMIITKDQERFILDFLR